MDIAKQVLAKRREVRFLGAHKCRMSFKWRKNGAGVKMSEKLDISFNKVSIQSVMWGSNPHHSTSINL